MDNNLQNLANISISNDTSPTLGGNLNPNGLSITANIAHILADNTADLQRSKAVFRFENTDTRENLASAIAIVGKGKNMRMGVLGNDPTAVGYGIAAGGNFIEGTVGLTSDLWFFNYGNIYTGLGTSITASGISLDSGKGVYINGVALTSYSNVQVATYLVANPPAGTYSNVQVASYVAGSTTQGSITLTGNIAGNTAGFAIGYRDMPQVAAANVTLALTDAGKHFYSTSAAPFTVTIPVNSTVAFAIGTVVSIVNQGTANLTVAKGSATLYLGGNTTSASRTITSYGVATLMKVATDTWFVNGSGVV
jgi:hypothetical protein